MRLRRGAAAHTHQPVKPSAARMPADIAEMLEMLQARLAEGDGATQSLGAAL